MHIVYASSAKHDSTVRHISYSKMETLCGRWAGPEEPLALPVNCDECRSKNGELIKRRKGSTGAHIHIGSNVPGYLPESDVLCFDSVESALDALKHELKDQFEHYNEQCEATTPEQQEKGSECCDWCDVAGDVQAAMAAVADGDAAHHVREGLTGRAAGRVTVWSLSWTFRPPAGADVEHWVRIPEESRDACDIYADQEA